MGAKRLIKVFSYSLAVRFIAPKKGRADLEAGPPVCLSDLL